MNAGKTLFAQVMDFVPWTSFGRIVDRHAGDAGVRRMNCTEQFRIMAFAQLTWRESLRDIEVTLASNRHKLYAMGLHHEVRRSTLADANEFRDWRIWSDFAALLISFAKYATGRFMAVLSCGVASHVGSKLATLEYLSNRDFVSKNPAPPLGAFQTAV